MRNKKNICPLLRKPCVEDECSWWSSLRGTDKNTGKEVDQGMCVLVAVPMLLIENASQQRATEGAIEVLRKVTDDKTEVTNRLLANMVIGTTVTQLPNSPQQELLPPED